MRKRAFAFLAGSVTLGLAAVGCNNATENVTVFAAQLAGANEVPPRPTAASGAAGFNLEGGTVTYSIEVHGLPDIVGAHIHSGGPTVNGPVRVNFYSGPARSAGDGVFLEGSFTAANVNGITFDLLVEQMRAGTAYVNVHSPTFPGGEIRGQIQLVAD